MVSGTREHVEALRDELAGVLAPMGLRLSDAKTRIAHIDEGFDFLGFRVQRRRKRGTNKRCVYTYPSKRSLASVKTKVRALTYRSSPIPPRVALLRVNAVLRGWCNYFRHGVSKATFSYLDEFAWRRVIGWLRRRHGGLSWKALRRRFCRNGWNVTVDGITLFNPQSVPVTRYRWRAGRIPTPVDGTDPNPRLTRKHGLVESRMPGDRPVRFGGRAEETDREKPRHRASARPLHPFPRL